MRAGATEKTQSLRGKIPPMSAEEISKVMEQQGAARQVVIKPPNLKRAYIQIKGIAPLRRRCGQPL